ncbi:MAG: ATP-binding protein [Vicinamibacterales bacterium]
MAARPLSLRARLLALVLSAVVVAFVLATAGAYVEARHEVDALLDAHLEQSLALLVAQAGEDLEEFDTEHAGEGVSVSNAVAFQIWDRGTRLALHSANAPDTPMGDRQTGFSDRVIAGTAWRVYTSWDHEGEYLIHVGERAGARQEILDDLVGAILAPLLVVLPVLGLLVWLAVSRGVRPVARVADEVQQRDSERLDPLGLTGVPGELVPLVERLNTLFARVTRSLDQERRFTADASHELRTPLAAIRAQAQVALGATDAGERAAVLQKVIAGCDRAARLVEQLLTLARLDGTPGEAPDTVDLSRLAAEVVADVAPVAMTRRIDVGLEAAPDASVRGHAALLRVLIRNLVDNAVRYSPDGSDVRVAMQQDGRHIILRVRDSGDGIPPVDRARVFERFYRVAGARADGSGLGLSIVAHIAEMHGARVEIGDGLDGRGTGVTVTFPAGA